MPDDSVAASFLYYLLQVGRSELRSRGQGTTFAELSNGALCAFPVPIPLAEEQSGIVRFLDHADRRIRRAIRAKEKLIALLKEQKQALIHDAVTGRTDVRTGQPYPAYKDSGVEWLGEIPEHWAPRRIRRFAQVLNGATPSSSNAAYWGGEIAWITPDDLGRLKGKHIARGSRSITTAGYRSCGTTIAPAGSIAISTRAPIGHLAILGSPACVNQGCRLLVPDDSVGAAFLYYLLQVGRSELQSRGQGTTFAELSNDALCAFSVPIPLAEEQSAIVRFLDHADRRILRAIRAKEDLITCLREFRIRLIADVVTGKLDVREAAAALPDEDAPTAGEERPEGL